MEIVGSSMSIFMIFVIFAVRKAVLEQKLCRGK